jgi:4-aminobutyrate aminotransferase
MTTTLVDHRPAPRLRTSLPGPRAAEWIARDQTVLSPSYTRLYPLVAARGWGCTLEDVDGNRFLDFTAGIAVTATGHAHPLVARAIAEQAAQLIHMSGTDFYYAPEIELAERLAGLVAISGPKRVFFTNSGTEAVEAALKLARWHTKRERVVAFYGAFHGRTYGSMSLSASKAVHRQGFGPFVEGVHHVPFGCGRAELESLFASVCPPDETAAVFVEPIQGEGGYRLPPPEFLPMLREVCDQHGMLLVVDEIQSGIGRTGRFLACEHFGVEPDLVCLAKGLASGMPLGALVARAEIMQWPPGSHASTFGGNPVCCRAALATLELVEQQYMENAARRGVELLAGLQRLGERHASVRNVRGLGLMCAFDACQRGQPDPAVRDGIIQAAFHRGLLLLPCGKAAVRLAPALCVTADEVSTALRVLDQVCAGDAVAP